MRYIRRGSASHDIYLQVVLEDQTACAVGKENQVQLINHHQSSKAEKGEKRWKGRIQLEKGTFQMSFQDL